MSSKPPFATPRMNVSHVRRANRPNTRLLLTKHQAQSRSCKREPSTQDEADHWHVFLQWPPWRASGCCSRFNLEQQSGNGKTRQTQQGHGRGYLKEAEPHAHLVSVCWAFSRCSRRFLKNLENLPSSAATVRASSKKRMFAIGMVDFSITYSFQILTHSLVVHRLPSQRPGNEFDLKGSGALEQTVTG